MILEKVKSILSEQFNIEESIITPETNLLKDLEMDSLDMADLIVTIESEFEIEEISDDIMNNISTVGDIINYLSEYGK